MKPIKEILFSLTDSYKQRVTAAQETAARMVRVAQAAKQAGREAEKPAAPPAPKK